MTMAATTTTAMTTTTTTTTTATTSWSNEQVHCALKGSNIDLYTPREVEMALE